jgi:hypothetical protein
VFENKVLGKQLNPDRMKYMRNKINYTMRNFITYTAHLLLLKMLQQGYFNGLNEEAR